MFVSSSITKLSLLGAVCAAAIFAAPMPAKAQDAGIYELAVQKPWRKVVDKQSACRYNGYLNQGNGIQVAYDKDSERTSIRYIAPHEIFVSSRLYQADVYVDFETHFASTATPLSGKTIEIASMDTRRFNKLFENVEEFSFGIDETLYVLNIARIPFPITDYQNCVRNQMPKDRGIIDAIAKMNPFALPEGAQEPELTTEEDVDQAEGDIEESKTEKPPEQPKKWKPFLTSYKATGPYALKPKSTSELEEAVKEHDKTAAQSDLAASEASDYSKSYRELEFENSSCGPANGTYEFSQIPEEEMPPEMRGLRGFMTGNDNTNTDKDLIQSLLVQLDLLEKEKEALRRKKPEDYNSISVIRSCRNESGTINELKSKLEEAETEQFELRKRQEIQNDLLKAYEGLDANAANVAEALEKDANAAQNDAQDEAASLDADLLPSPSEVDKPVLDPEMFMEQDR